MTKQHRVRLILDLFVPAEQSLQAQESLNALVTWGLNRGSLGLLDLHSYSHSTESLDADSIDVLMERCKRRWGTGTRLRYDEREGFWRVEAPDRHVLVSDETTSGLRRQLIELLAAQEQV